MNHGRNTCKTYTGSNPGKSFTGIPGKIIGKIHELTSVRISKENLEKIIGEILGLGVMNQESQGGLPETIPGGKSKKNPERISDKRSGIICERILEGIPGKKPKGSLDDIPEKKPERIPEQIH